MNILASNIHGKLKIILILFVVMAVNGCAQLSSVSGPGYTDNVDERSAFEYYRWLKSSPEVVIEREKQYLGGQLAVLDPVVSKARLAMLLTLSVNTKPEDEQLALDLLGKVIEKTATSGDSVYQDYRKFSILWRDIILQRQKLRQSLNKANQLIAEKSEKAESLQKENAELVKQIEALKSIEQQINKREQSRDKSE